MDPNLQLLNAVVWVAASLLVISTSWCLMIVSTLSHEFFRRRLTAWRNYLRKAFLMMLVSSSMLLLSITLLLIHHITGNVDVLLVQRLATLAFILPMMLMLFYLGSTLKGGAPSRLRQLRELDAEIEHLRPGEFP